MVQEERKGKVTKFGATPIPKLHRLELMKFIPALRHPKTNGTYNKEWQKFTCEVFEYFIILLD